MKSTMNSNNDTTATLMERILYEVKRVVVGQDQFLVDFISRKTVF